MDESPVVLPFFQEPVRAGFPSPAEDYVAEQLNLNEYLNIHKSACFMLRAKGDSMIDCGIHDGDVWVVDRSLAPLNGSVVIAAVDGMFTVKKLECGPNRLRLLSGNAAYQPIEFKDGQEMQVVGVVTNVIHSLKP